jgi:Fe-S-cluster containining protein
MPPGSPSPSQLDAAVAEVRAVYKELAARPVERNCTLLTECCQFQLTGKIPHLTKGEAVLAARALKASGRKSLPESARGACPLLDPRTMRCLIYDSRPFGCRTHFCVSAGGPYSRKEVTDLIHRLEAVDDLLQGNGPRALPGAVSEALLGFAGKRK